jgi:hypothetical protein
MSPETKIPGLLLTTHFNAMPGALSDGSGCCLSKKFPVCYHKSNIDRGFISMENCSLETCAWTGRKTPVQLNKVTLVEDLFSLIRFETKVFNVILFLRIIFSFIQRKTNLIRVSLKIFLIKEIFFLYRIHPMHLNTKVFRKYKCPKLPWHKKIVATWHFLNFLFYFYQADNNSNKVLKTEFFTRG